MTNNEVKHSVPDKQINIRNTDWFKNKTKKKQQKPNFPK